MSGMNRGTCLVTGAAGFVGSHLAEKLLGLGYGVVGVDNFFSGRRENIEILSRFPGFHFIETSITEPRLLARIRREHQDLRLAFHLAAIVSVPYSMEHEEETLEVNWRASEALLREAEELGLEGFVFAGSAAEYGPETRLPVREEYATDDTVHLSPYGRAKYLSSRATAASPIGASLRFFNIYGPRQDPSSPYSGVISRFMDLSLAGRPLTVFGDGSQSRDFVYISDVVSSYLIAAGVFEQGEQGGRRPDPGVYNIGTSRALTVLGLAQTVAGLAGSRAGINFLPPRPGDIQHSLASVDKIATACGWQARIGLEEGLAETLGWYKDASLKACCG